VNYFPKRQKNSLAVGNFADENGNHHISRSSGKTAQKSRCIQEVHIGCTVYQNPNALKEELYVVSNF